MLVPECSSKPCDNLLSLLYTPFPHNFQFFLVPSICILLPFRLSHRWRCLQWGEFLTFIFQIILITTSSFILSLLFDCLILVPIFIVLFIRGLRCFPVLLWGIYDCTTVSKFTPKCLFFCGFSTIIITYLPPLPDDVWSLFWNWFYFILYVGDIFFVSMCFFTNLLFIGLLPHTLCGVLF